MFGFLKKLFGSDIPAEPVISQPKVEPVQEKVETPAPKTTTAKKAPAKKPAAKKAPAKKPAVAKTGDAPKRRGRPPKSAS